MQSRNTDVGSRIFEDHRDNLTVDVMNSLVEARAPQMRSEDSPSAMLWNVFRSLQKLEAPIWLPRLLTQANQNHNRIKRILPLRALEEIEFHWWKSYDLPPARHEWLHEAAINANLHLEHYPSRYLAEKKKEISRRLENELMFEEAVEIPLCIETRDWMLGILAVYKGNLRQTIRYDAQRDEILRMLDAGSHAAAAQNKRFMSLVVYTDARTYNTETKSLIDRYQNNPGQLKAKLCHRSDMKILQSASQLLGALRWRDLGSVLIDVKREERIGLFDVTILDELIKYLARKEIGFNFFRRLK